MRILAASESGHLATENEDWLHATPDLTVMLDGATVRTDTGCTHGIAWYVANLGSLITSRAADATGTLTNALRLAINDTNSRHLECDLNHPGTPSAAVAIARRENETLHYLVLGDVTLILETDSGLQIVTDSRVEQTAPAERLEAARLPFGSVAKQEALLRMKNAELAARNVEDGYWIAAANPRAADHAIVGTVPLAELRSLAMLTDGAARAVVPFQLLDWPAALELLASEGPDHLIRLVREAERKDKSGKKWPRNKCSDDASVVHVSLR